MTEPATPKIVSRDQWERACAELLVREKAHTRAGDEVFQTYETKWRGIEAMLPTLQLLDLTEYGRQETWEGDLPTGLPQDQAGSWWRRDGRPIAQWTRTDAAVK